MLSNKKLITLLTLCLSGTGLLFAAAGMSAKDLYDIITKSKVPVARKFTQVADALTSGAQINDDTDRIGFSPLNAALGLDDGEEIVKLLLQQPGIDVNEHGTGAPLHRALARGNVDMVTLLLAHSANPNLRQKRLQGDRFVEVSSPLETAVRSRNVDVVRALLAAPQLDVNLPPTPKHEDKNRTSLHSALEVKNPEIVEVLVNNPRMNLRQGSPLTAAVRSDDPALVQIVAAAGQPRLAASDVDTAIRTAVENNNAAALQVMFGTKNLNAQYNLGHLFSAIQHNHADRVQEIIASGTVDINACSKDTTQTNKVYLNKTPLSYALEYCAAKEAKDLSVVQAILNAPNFDPAASDDDASKMNALHHVVQHGKYRVIRNLMPQLIAKNPALINSQDTSGHTPLHHAVSSGNFNVVLAVLKTPQVDVNALNSAGKTPLFLVQNKSSIDALVKAGANINMQDTSGCTPLFHIVDGMAQNRDALVDALLAHNADVTIRNNHGSTVLHAAARFYQTSKDLLIKLQAGKIDANAQDTDGNTPLHKAGSAQIVEALLDMGANPNARNAAGKTPFHKAFDASNLTKHNGNAGELAEALMSRGARPDCTAQDAEGNTPLHILAQNSGRVNKKKAFELLQKIAPTADELNMTNNEGKTVLHCALGDYQPGEDFIKTIIAINGVEKNKVDNNGRTPYDLGKHRGALRTKEFTKALQDAGLHKAPKPQTPPTTSSTPTPASQPTLTSGRATVLTPGSANTSPQPAPSASTQIAGPPGLTSTVSSTPTPQPTSTSGTGSASTPRSANTSPQTGSSTNSTPRPQPQSPATSTVTSPQPNTPPSSPTIPAPQPTSTSGNSSTGSASNQSSSSSADSTAPATLFGMNKNIVRGVLLAPVIISAVKNWAVFQAAQKIVVAEHKIACARNADLKPLTPAEVRTRALTHAWKNHKAVVLALLGSTLAEIVALCA